MQIDYEKLLNLFVSTDTFRHELSKPFKEGDFCYGTDATVLCQIPATFLPDLNELEKPLNCKDVILPVLQNNEINIVELNNLFENIPLKPALIDKTTKCDACAGTGDVDYKFSHKGKDYNNMFRCPICGGSGRIGDFIPDPSGAMVPDYENGIIKIGEKSYSVNKLNKIIEASKILETETFAITNSTIGLQIKIKDAVILLMPLHIDKDAENVATAQYHFLGEITYTTVLINVK